MDFSVLCSGYGDCKAISKLSWCGVVHAFQSYLLISRPEIGHRSHILQCMQCGKVPLGQFSCWNFSFISPRVVT